MTSIKHESEKKMKIHQLVASTDTPKLGIKARKSLSRQKTKCNVENVSPNNKSPGSRQTVLSEYFESPNASPKETPVCQSDRDEPVQKMVNVPKLLRQLLRARVVLSRIPDEAPTPMKTQATTTTAVMIKDNLQSGRVVQRYCYKCKTFEIDGWSITKRKLCQKCGTLLLFVCIKCNSKHFIENRHMMKHFTTCNGRVDLSYEDTLDSVVLRFCADCPFKTTYRYMMNKHLKSTGHKALDGEKFIEPDQLDFKAKELEDARAQFIVKQHIISSKKHLKRYCSNCKRAVVASRSADDAICQTCNTRLLYQCAKCRWKSTSYKHVYYHVRTKCYPTIYRCPKCYHTTPFWQQMDKHLKKRRCLGHISVLSRRRKHGKIVKKN